jgi:hypothetical protein
MLFVVGHLARREIIEVIFFVFLNELCFSNYEWRKVEKIIHFMIFQVCG